MEARVANAEGRAWVATRVGCHLTPEARGIVAVDGKGNVRGGVVYDGWTPNSVQCHMAVDTPIAWRALIPHVFLYPFLESRRGILLGMVCSSNRRSLAAALHMGFREVGRVKDGHSRGEDMVLIEMRREECRYLPAQRKVA